MWSRYRHQHIADCMAAVRIGGKYWEEGESDREVKYSIVWVVCMMVVCVCV